jgi:hypothetical protein
VKKEIKRTKIKKSNYKKNYPASTKPGESLEGISQNLNYK